jgi:hypothetical protein
VTYLTVSLSHHKGDSVRKETTWLIKMPGRQRAETSGDATWSYRSNPTSGAYLALDALPRPFPPFTSFFFSLHILFLSSFHYARVHFNQQWIRRILSQYKVPDAISAKNLHRDVLTSMYLWSTFCSTTCHLSSDASSGKTAFDRLTCQIYCFKNSNISATGLIRS